MISAVNTEIHYNIQNFTHTVSPTTDKVMKLCPKLILGSSFLFEYDHDKCTILLSSSFKDLLILLVKLKELDPKVLDSLNLFELNGILQKPQAANGGMMRKPGSERWEMKDAQVLVDHYFLQDKLLEQLGFSTPREIPNDLTVRHCILFGARAERMEKRILITVDYLNTKLTVTDHIYLAGSKARKLIPEELKFIQDKLIMVENPQEKSYWTEVFENPEEAHEANAFMFLWKSLVPEVLQNQYNSKLIAIQATRIGPSYNLDQGNRSTTETTAEDWLSYYVEGQFQTFFALAEQPFIRLPDQLRMTVLTNKKEASLDSLKLRIDRTVFYFVNPVPPSSPLKTVVFDEIARHVFRTVDTLKYLDSKKDP